MRDLCADFNCTRCILLLYGAALRVRYLPDQLERDVMQRKFQMEHRSRLKESASMVDVSEPPSASLVRCTIPSLLSVLGASSDACFLNRRV